MPTAPRRAVSTDWPDAPGRPRPLGLAEVRLGGFLGRRVARSNGPSLAAGLDSPVFRGYEADAVGGGWDGEYRRRGAADTDLYKWLEAACYASAGDADLRGEIDRVVEVILAAQRPAGFIHTNRSPDEGLDPRARNELYLAGHLFEAAIAHFHATGESALLDAACGWADFLHERFVAGDAYFDDVPEHEHPEAELALIRLFRATGDERYLDFARDLAARATVTEAVGDLRCGPHDRHAVCTFYMLTAWAELFLQTDDQRWLRPLLPLLDELEATRLYAHGGVGVDEIIPATAWHLPQAGSVAETCASVALMMLARRMAAITGTSRWFDLIERALYNAFLGALSADQLAIFYFNPLSLLRPGDEGRQDLPGERMRLPALHRTSCCFPNAWRLLASLPEWVFAARDDVLQVNLFSDADCRARIAGVTVTLRVRTSYPVAGRVELTLEPERPVHFGLELRIPAWCEGATVGVCGASRSPATSGCYHTIDREWARGDVVVLELPMPPAAIASGPDAAFSRGPLLYCVEEQDAPGTDLGDLAVPREALSDLRAAPPVDVSEGLPVLEVATVGRTEARLIPWFARGNRASRHWRALLPLIGD